MYRAMVDRWGREHGTDVDPEGARARLQTRLMTIAARHAAEPLPCIPIVLRVQRRCKALLAAVIIAQVLVNEGLAPSAAQRLLTRMQALAQGERQAAARVLGALLGRGA